MMRKMEPDHHGKWSKFHPLWDGFYTFLFTPGETTKKGAHIRDGIDLKRTMAMVIVALLPCLLFGMYNTGHWHYVVETQNLNLPYWDDFGAKLGYGFLQILPLIIVSYGVGLGVEFAFAIKNGHPIQEGFLVSGMLIPLIVPSDIPLWMVAVATVFAVVLAKEVFGGTGMNVVNVALMARAFLFFAYPSNMAGDKVWMSGLGDRTEPLADGFSGATPLGELYTMTTETPVHANLDAFAAKWNFWDAFWGYIPGSVGETSFFCCMIGAFILLYTGIASWKIMVSFFAGGLVIGYLLNALAVNPYMELDPMYHMVLGGFAFGAVFMATDPVTAAQTSTGKYIYGFLAGAMAIVIRVLNPAFPEGVMMAILLLNVLAPLIDHYVIQSNIKRRMKRLKTA
jgi:Na+-transporting NADH:ubiquinone oxidoreductase subunit B